MSDVLALVEVLGRVLGPLLVSMLERALAGGDPLDLLAKEHVADVVPDPLRLELAERAARARLAGKKS